MDEFSVETRCGCYFRLHDPKTPGVKSRWNLDGKECVGVALAEFLKTY